MKGQSVLNQSRCIASGSAGFSSTGTDTPATTALFVIRRQRVAGSRGMSFERTEAAKRSARAANCLEDEGPTEQEPADELSATVLSTATRPSCRSRANTTPTRTGVAEPEPEPDDDAGAGPDPDPESELDDGPGL